MPSNSKVLRIRRNFSPPEGIISRAGGRGKGTTRRFARIDLLEDIFELEAELGQYSAATTTLENDSVLVASAFVVNPRDCDAGVALWDYVPVRRTFSFANLNGNVERFEARCEESCPG